jgi:hypothetical protein
VEPVTLNYLEPHGGFEAHCGVYDAFDESPVEALNKLAAAIAAGPAAEVGTQVVLAAAAPVAPGGTATSGAVSRTAPAVELADIADRLGISEEELAAAVAGREAGPVEASSPGEGTPDAGAAITDATVAPVAPPNPDPAQATPASAPDTAAQEGGFPPGTEVTRTGTAEGTISAAPSPPVQEG